MNTVEDAIIRVMYVNLSTMGVNLQSVPTVGSTGSLRSRGYLFGMTQAVMEQFADLHPTQEEFMAAFAHAFAATYGPCDWGWALDTIDSIQTGDADTVIGAKFGRRDVQAIYRGDTLSPPTGFWLLNNGDEAAVQYNLAQL